MRERQEARSEAFDFVFGEIQRAVSDVRSKLIDEGWFGRRAGPSSDRNISRDWNGPSIHDQPGLSAARPSFEEAWAARAPGEVKDAAEPGGMDLDR